MKKMKFSIGLLFMMINLVSCAQNKNTIKKAVAFSSIHIPGNIPVDENGNSLFKGPDTLNTIYIETNQKNIQWDKAWKNGKAYAVTKTLLPVSAYRAGTEKNSGKTVVYTAEKGYQQWLLALTPLDDKQTPPLTMKKGEILLSFKYENKTMTQVIKQQTELEVLPSY